MGGYIAIFFIGCWIGCFVGILVFALFNSGKIDKLDD